MALVRKIENAETGEVISRSVINTNSNFTMIYNEHFNTIQVLIKNDSKAGELFMFLIGLMGKDNALIISNEAIADNFGWSSATVTRKIKYLKDNQFVHVAKTGSSNIYYVNSQIAWKNTADRRKVSQFQASVFITEKEQEKAKFPLKTEFKVHAKQVKKMDDKVKE